MTKFKVTSAYKARFSEKMMDLGNLAVAGLVIGQFVSGQEFSMPHLVAGFIILVLCYIISLLVSP